MRKNVCYQFAFIPFKNLEDVRLVPIVESIKHCIRIQNLFKNVLEMNSGSDIIVKKMIIMNGKK